MDVSAISSTFAASKVRYADLLEMMRGTKFEEYYNSGKTVDVYIDLFNILRRLYANGKNHNTLEAVNTLTEDDMLVISSEIVNFVGHYRSFITRSLGMRSRFYIFYSDQESSYAQSIYSEYMKNEYATKLPTSTESSFSLANLIIYQNIKVSENIFSYIPGVYMINTGIYPVHYFPYHTIKMNHKVDDRGNSNLSLIIAKDEVYYQDVLDTENTYMITGLGKNARLLSKDNILSYYFKLSQTEIDDMNIHGFSSIYTLAGSKKLEVPNVKSYVNKKLAKGINRQNGYDYTSQDDMKFIMKLDESDFFNGAKYDTDEAKRNFNLLNHQATMYNTDLSNDIENIVKSNLIDLDNPDKVQLLNDKMYRNFPMILSFLYNQN